MTAMRVFRPLLAVITRRALAGRLGPAESAAVLDETLRRYEAKAARVPRERNIGARLMVRLAALTLSFHEALCAGGQDDASATALTARATWLVYRRMAVVPRTIARFTSWTPRGRLRRATDLFRRFPFGRPGYAITDVAAEPDVVAFDVRRCPVAEYFGTHQRSNLCVHSFCNLDFPLAKEWHAVLDRRTTLAEGADCCDFRWRPLSAP